MHLMTSALDSNTLTKEKEYFFYIQCFPEDELLCFNAATVKNIHIS